MRTSHEYVEDYDASSVTQMAMGLTGADFDMDVLVTTVSGELRHTEGDLNGEVVRGRRNGAMITQIAMSMHDAGFGGFSFNMQSTSGFSLDPYVFYHVPGRTVNGERISSDQDYGYYYETSYSTSSSDLSSATWPELNYASTSSLQTLRTLTVVTGPNPGQVTRSQTSSGTNTDRYGDTTSYSTTSNGVQEQLGDNYVLGLTDQHQPLPSLGGYSNIWQSLSGLQTIPGYSNFSTAWANGMSAVVDGAGRRC